MSSISPIIEKPEPLNSSMSLDLLLSIGFLVVTLKYKFFLCTFKLQLNGLAALRIGKWSHQGVEHRSLNAGESYGFDVVIRSLYILTRSRKECSYTTNHQ